MSGRPVAVEQRLATLLTEDCLGPYLAVSNGSLEAALDLYEWNSRIGAAMFEDLGYLEVILRNACHQQLQQWSENRSRDPVWYLQPTLTPASRVDVDKARRRATRAGRDELAGRGVAELMFGFWRFLHARAYEATLWTPCLRKAYPHLEPQRRQLVYTRLDHLNTLRNRIAHHEPIHADRIAGTGTDVGGLYNELL